MKRILVPTDFSEVSESAIISSASFAKKFEGQITLLYVNDNTPVADARARLERIREEKIFEGIKVKVDIKDGDPIEEIVDYPADFIIIGGREVTGIKGFFTRTTAEKVAKQSDCPVITVKQSTDFSMINSIVFATDMRSEQLDLIPDVKEIQQRYKSHIHLVKVYGDTMISGKDVEKRLKNFAEFNKLIDYSVTAIKGSDEADEILRFARDLGSQMIIMATHDWKGIGKLLGGFISSEVLKESKIAVMTKSIDD